MTAMSTPPFEPWLTLRVDGPVAVMTRTATPFERIEDVRRAYGTLTETLEALEAVPCLLTDLRPAPGRNDPAFEKVLAPLRRRIYAAFERRAVVVRTAIGRLQVQRHADADGIAMRVFLEPEEALDWLRGS